VKEPLYQLIGILHPEMKEAKLKNENKYLFHPGMMKNYLFIIHPIFTSSHKCSRENSF
jgi:hypothetical protein